MKSVPVRIVSVFGLFCSVSVVRFGDPGDETYLYPL